MNKTAKGALATGAAAVLLLGGASTLAYWTDDATVNGGDISSGFLTLSDGECDGDWTHVNGPRAGTALVEFVPGDVLTQDCTFSITGEGDNLVARPEVQESVTVTNAGDTSFEATAAATYDLGGDEFTDADVVTPADSGETLTATILVTIPYGTDEGGVDGDEQTPADTVNGNDTQNLTAALEDLSVTLTQLDPATLTPAP